MALEGPDSASMLGIVVTLDSPLAPGSLIPGNKVGEREGGSGPLPASSTKVPNNRLQLGAGPL